MQRRSFIRNAAFSAVAVSAPGFIHFDGTRYVGDCETTTDILGPYYRPDSPLRNSLAIPGEKGNPVMLSGVIRHKDCTAPFKGAKVELWHCSPLGVYDNDSKEYRYRGTTFTDDKGHYSFETIFPVPYDAGGGMIRPAHFHLMVTAEKYQPLVTQLYFSGDPNIAKDPWASATSAKRRILEVKAFPDGKKNVLYNVSMSEMLAADPATIDRIAGVYVDEKDKSSRTEFFRKDNMLWMKSEVFGRNFEYAGDNVFVTSGPVEADRMKCRFEIIEGGAVRVTMGSYDDNGKRSTTTAIREKKV